MNIALGTHVYTKDNKDLGTIERLVLDPQSDMVKAAVVTKGFLLQRDVEVPAEMITAGPSGDARIPYTADEVHKLPVFQPADYTSPPAEYLANTPYPPGSIYWPVGYNTGMMPMGMQPPANPTSPSWTGNSAIDQEIKTALRRQDLDNAVVGAGSDVLGRDGEKVGSVREMMFDPASGELTGMVVHKGLFLGKDTSLPATLIDSVDDGVVYLKVNAKEAVK